MTPMLRRFLLMIMVVASTCSIGQTADRPTWHKSDAWTYKTLALSDSQFKGSLEGVEIFTVVEVSSDGYEVTIRGLGANNDTTYEWRGRTSINARPMTQGTADGSWGEARWTSWPLSPRDPLAFAGKQADETAFQRETTITEWEELTVPAGRFKALHIVVNFSKGQLFRQDTWWYAPEVKRHIRHEQVTRLGAFFVKSHTIAELVSYTLN